MKRIFVALFALCVLFSVTNIPSAGSGVRPQELGPIVDDAELIVEAHVRAEDRGEDILAVLDRVTVLKGVASAAPVLLQHLSIFSPEPYLVGEADMLLFLAWDKEEGRFESIGAGNGAFFIRKCSKSEELCATSLLGNQGLFPNKTVDYRMPLRDLEEFIAQRLAVP